MSKMLLERHSTIRKEEREVRKEIFKKILMIVKHHFPSRQKYFQSGDINEKKTLVFLCCKCHRIKVNLEGYSVLPVKNTMCYLFI